ncbi:unnamed protein product [Lactuca saligna]|uniref:Arabidopsis retrotransposon Orf1 C-terminal domain-containing protein n=1 Tax=Lactuca saligna TaxID=75948 RepID=A0AA35ZAH7_LACSI|nr:unnamed protein product [Lactuca saligna]
MLDAANPQPELHPHVRSSRTLNPLLTKIHFPGVLPVGISRNHRHSSPFFFLYKPHPNSGPICGRNSGRHHHPPPHIFAFSGQLRPPLENPSTGFCFSHQELSSHTNLSAKTHEKFPSNSECCYSIRRKVILKLVCGVVLAIKASNTEQNCKLGVCLDEIILVALVHPGLRNWHAKTGTGATSSKGGSKGKSKDPPFRLLNREDRKTYDFLVSNKRQVKSTKFLHRESFASLGVLDGVQALFNNIGWGQFLHNRAATYVEPTLEFLTTFNPEEEAQTVTFQILGEKRSLPHRVVNALMGAPVDNLYYQQDPWPGNFNEHYFWQQITNEPQYSSSSSKASSIIHPCLRLAHRVLTCTIFARSEVGQISKAELFFLWCMTRENGPRPDFASFFFTKCYNLTTMDKGDIFIGGLITLIASRPPLQLHLSTLPFEKASGPSSLDGNALRRMQLIRDSVVGPMWILDNQPYLILPHEYIESFEPTDPDQWIIPSDYPPPVDDEDDQFQPAQQFAEP